MCAAGKIFWLQKNHFFARGIDKSALYSYNSNKHSSVYAETK